MVQEIAWDKFSFRGESGAGSELLEHYVALESQLTVSEGPEYARLVLPDNNSSLPIHRWFHFKEAFSAALLPTVLDDLGLSRRGSLAVLDSFAGTGTTLVSAQSWVTDEPGRAVLACGIERNPFLALVARCKVEAHPRQAGTFVREAAKMIAKVRAGALDPAPTPHLSTFSNSAYFPPSVLRGLLEVRAGIDRFATSPASRRLALLALGAVVEPSSRLRRDGRALRYEVGKSLTLPVDRFEAMVRIIADDLMAAGRRGRVSIRAGDGRNPAAHLPYGRVFDLAIFSPPYINNIDYTEIYKLETWLLGFVKTRQEFRAQRRLTMRSHPSVRFGGEFAGRQQIGPARFDDLLLPLITAVPDTADRQWRRRLLLEYFDDLAVVFLRHRDLLRRDGRLVCIIGNSVHGKGDGQFVVAADLIAARLAEMAGYQVERIKVARHASRTARNQPLARESLLMLRVCDS